MKRRDFQLIYANYNNGNSFQTIFNKCAEHPYNSMILFIEDN